jgi:hypothetical protein
MIDDLEFLITDQDIEEAIANAPKELKPYLNAPIRSESRKLPKKRKTREQVRSQETGST